MPAWIIQFLVNLAIQFGLPWLIKVFPWAKQFEDILAKLIKDIEDAMNKKEVAVAKANAKFAVANRVIESKYGPVPK